MKQTKAVILFLFLFLFLFQPNTEARASESDSVSGSGMQVQAPVSLLLVFHDLGWNFLGSVTYNYGLNFAGAGLGTWAFIETGLDWKWRNVAYNNEWLANAGLPVLFAGYLVPVITPLSVYLAGLYLSDTKLQITALALAQALLITQAFHLPLKMITGRTVPGVISGVFFEPNNYRDSRTEDFSEEFNWFKFDVLDGWPSGHTACAFSAAAVLAEMYDDRPLLKIGAYAWAFLMGFGVSVNAHWASDSIAAALYGYAVGKTVGKSFKKLLGKKESNETVSFYVVPNSAGVIIRL